MPRVDITDLKEVMTCHANELRTSTELLRHVVSSVPCRIQICVDVDDLHYDMKKWVNNRHLLKYQHLRWFKSKLEFFVDFHS